MSIKSVKFRGRHISGKSVFFLVTGSITLVMLVMLPVLSSQGLSYGAAFGIIGTICAIADLLGLIVCVVATNETDVVLKHPIAGMIVNGIAMVCYVIVYFLGMA